MVTEGNASRHKISKKGSEVDIAKNQVIENYILPVQLKVLEVLLVMQDITEDLLKVSL